MSKALKDMVKKNLFRTPTLYDSNGETSKKWFISWYEWNDSKIILERKRFYGILNQLPIEERYTEAKIIMAEIEVQLLRKYKDVEISEEKTLHDLILEIASSKKLLRDKSFYTYSIFSKHFCAYLLAKNMSKMLAREFSAAHAYTYMDTIASENKGPCTWNNYRNILKTFFFALMHRGYINKNPFVEIKPIPAPPKSHVAFTTAQQIKITKHLSVLHPRLLLYCSFIYYCFIRPGRELRNLKIKYIDFANRKIMVPAAIAKNGKTMWVVIPDQFYDFLNTFNLQEEDPEKFIFSNDFYPGFTPIKNDKASKMHKTILDDLRIPTGRNGCTLYSWKHTGASRYAMAGTNLKDLQLQLRHHSLEEVDIYLRSLGVEASTKLRSNFPSINGK